MLHCGAGPVPSNIDPVHFDRIMANFDCRNQFASQHFRLRDFEVNLVTFKCEQFLAVETIHVTDTINPKWRLLDRTRLSTEGICVAYGDTGYGYHL